MLIIAALSYAVKWLPHGVWDVRSQLDTGSRSRNPLTNTQRVFRMMFQHVLVAAPHPHPVWSYSFPVCMCAFIDKRSPVVNPLFFPSLWLLQLSTAHPVVRSLTVCLVFYVRFSLHTLSLICWGRLLFVLKSLLEIRGEAAVGLEDIKQKQGQCWMDPRSDSSSTTSERWVIQRLIKRKG